MTGGGGASEAPPQDLGRKSADRRKTWQALQKLRKEKDHVIFHKKLNILLVMIIYANHLHK